MMKFKTLIFALFCSTSFITFGQTYKTAIGLKGDVFGLGAINVKHFISSSNALEFSLGGSNNGLWLSGLYEWQAPTDWTEGLDWYYGFGVVTGSWNSGLGNSFNSGFHFGARGVIGIDFSFTKIPLNLAVDSGPYIGIINSRFGWQGGFALRYLLNR